MSLAVVSTLVPGGDEFQTPVLSIAGQRFQRGALEALQRAGMPPRLVLSLRPVPAFPKGRRLWFRPGRRQVGPDLAVELLPILNLQPLKSLLAGLATFSRLLRWAWSERRSARTVLAINLSQPPGVFPFFACRLTGTRLVGWLLDVFEPGRLVPDSPLRRLDYRLQRWLIPRLDGLIVVADDIARDLAPGKRFLRVEGGVDREVVREPPAPPPPREAGELHCLFAGSLEEFNGIGLMLAAFRHLQGSPVALEVAGGGSLEAEVSAAAREGLAVKHLGVVGFDELWRRYGAADLLLNIRPTRSLSTRYFFPSKLMEYLASGTPVVSTCTGHVEDEFGEFVYLLREETPAALAALIRRVAAADPQERRAMGAKARAYVLAHKTWDAQAQRLARYLRSTASREAHSGA